MPAICLIRTSGFPEQLCAHWFPTMAISLSQASVRESGRFPQWARLVAPERALERRQTEDADCRICSSTFALGPRAPGKIALARFWPRCSPLPASPFHRVPGPPPHSPWGRVTHTSITCYASNPDLVTPDSPTQPSHSFDYCRAFSLDSATDELTRAAALMANLPINT